MNDFLLLVLLEKLVSLYDNGNITLSGQKYKSEFRSLIGEIKDALSCVE